jgi:hypothetical protein
MNALERMRQAAREEEERKATSQTKTKTRGDGASFQIGEIPDNTTTVIRILPDGDTNNVWPWVERQVCKLVFEGQIGGEYATDETVEVTVPCIDMYNAPGAKSTCPIIIGTRHLWADKTDEAAIALARQYYKKRSFLYQGFVVSTALEEEELPENPIRRFNIYTSIHNKIKSFVTDTDFEDSPTDYLLGRDFKIKKDKAVGATWPDYGGSSWGMKVRALNEEENIAIQQHGLFNLSDFIGVKPDADGVAMIKAMFEDSFAGKPYDFESYGAVYRAYKIKGSGERRADPDAISHAQAEKAEKVEKVERSAPRVVEDAEPASTDKPKKSATQILNDLKNKHKTA